MARTRESAIATELDAISAIIARRPQGMSRGELEEAFSESNGRALHARTIARRLDRLIDDGRVVADLTSPAPYRPGPALIFEAPPPEPGYVPLTKEGAQVRALVRRAMVDRKPVGYDPTLLDKYRPGRTWYLPAATRQQLHEVGRTPDPERPAGTYAREILGRLIIDLAWASSRLEGSTYSRLDTQNLIEFGEQAEGKDVAEAQMILNHKSAIELLVENADAIGFDRSTMYALHARLAENLLSNPADEGRLREAPVDIGGTPYRPLAIPQRIAELFDRVLEKASAIPDAFEQAFFVMVHLPYLQPFIDVNKRTSRLAANISLIKANLCPLSFVDVPNVAYVEGTMGVYELGRVDLLRDVFVWAYERSCAQYRVVRDAMGEPDPFRLRYRLMLREVVAEVVRDGQPPKADTLRRWADAHAVPADDVALFVERALELLLALNEGSASRYGLRPSEFSAWRARAAAGGAAAAARGG